LVAAPFGYAFAEVSVAIIKRSGGALAGDRRFDSVSSCDY